MFMLKLVSTEKLVQELLDRFDHAIFAGTQLNDTQNITIRETKGDQIDCLGLCKIVEQLAYLSWVNSQKPTK